MRNWRRRRQVVLPCSARRPRPSADSAQDPVSTSAGTSAGGSSAGAAFVVRPPAFRSGVNNGPDASPVQADDATSSGVSSGVGAGGPNGSSTRACAFVSARGPVAVAQASARTATLVAALVAAQVSARTATLVAPVAVVVAAAPRQDQRRGSSEKAGSQRQGSLPEWQEAKVAVAVVANVMAALTTTAACRRESPTPTVEEPQAARSSLNPVAEEPARVGAARMQQPTSASPYHGLAAIPRRGHARATRQRRDAAELPRRVIGPRPVEATTRAAKEAWRPPGHVTACICALLRRRCLRQLDYTRVPGDAPLPFSTLRSAVAAGCVGGHLFDGTVLATCDFHFLPFP